MTTPRILQAVAVGAIALCALLLGATPDAAAQPFTEAYTLVDTWTTRPPSTDLPQLVRPAGLDVAEDDSVYVTDRTAAKLVRLSAAGRVLDEWAVGPAVPLPDDVAVSADRILVVGRNAGELRDRGGRVLRTLTLPGVSGVAAGVDGRFYVPQHVAGPGRGDTVITVLDSDGNEVDSMADDPLTVVSPLGVDVAPNGTVYLAADGAVYVFEGGRIVRGLRVPSALEGGDILDVVADPEGRVFALQGGGSRRLFAWRAGTGDLIGYTSLSGAQSLAVGPGAGIVASVYVNGGFAGLSYLSDRGDLDIDPQRWGDAEQSLGEIVGPRRIATSSSGNVFMVDKRQRVQLWSRAGVPVQQWSAGSLSYLNDIAGGGEAPCAIASRALKCFGSGQDPDWEATPGAAPWLTAGSGSTNEVAAVDLVEQLVWVYHRDGSVRSSWPLNATGGFASVSDVAVDAGAVYLADRARRKIVVRSLDGRPGAPGEFDASGEVFRIAAGAGGIFALARDGWIYKYSSAGSLRTAWQPAHEEIPSDLAVAPDGRVYVTMPGLEQDGPDQQGRILVFEPGGTPPGSIPDTPELSCVVNVDKIAEPRTVVQGEDVEITLIVDGECPYGDGQLDIALLIDQSGSMTGSPLAAAQSAAISFLGQLDPEGAHVAVVGFSTSAAVLQPLTGDLRDVVRAVGLIEAGGQTNYRDALEKALIELTSPRARSGVPQVVVMMTDGKPTDRNLVVRASDDLKSIGATLYTIGLGPNVDAELLRTIASERELYFEAPTEAELADVYTVIARRITASRLLQNAAIEDVLPDDMKFVSGSAKPQSWIDGRTLSWSLAEVQSTGAMITYKVRPREPGLRPTNVRATLDYEDALGHRGQAVFPIPRIEVIQRTSWSAHLPVVWKSHCRPQRADVVLVFDTSSSMTGPAQTGSAATKLDAALEAGRTFLNAMQLPGDQASIVTFDENARRMQGLTGSRAALELALVQVRSGSGTRIDRGLEVAIVELLGARHDPRNNPVIILLTDGLPEEGSEGRTFQVARDAHSAGINVFTVGLGSDADPDLLWLVSGSDGRTFLAPDAGQLESIYRQIAGQVLCD